MLSSHVGRIAKRERERERERESRSSWLRPTPVKARQITEISICRRQCDSDDMYLGGDGGRLEKRGCPCPLRHNRRCNQTRRDFAASVKVDVNASLIQAPVSWVRRKLINMSSQIMKNYATVVSTLLLSAQIGLTVSCCRNNQLFWLLDTSVRKQPTCRPFSKDNRNIFNSSNKGTVW